ncbi:MAG: hypothetical protein HYZ25_02760 [Chloroflexi bacterium]|nr:hypothetical protein [Chloroflexota bacterium]
MAENPKPRKGIPFWLTLLLGTLIACVVMNAITISFQLGAMNSWESFKSPPSGAKRIIDANWREIWIETNDGQIFTACLYGPDDELCPQWKLVENVSEVPEQSFPISRGNDCKDLQEGTFPRNPKGQMVECIYAYFPGPEMGEEVYFALMEDGSVKYWNNGGSIIATQIFFVFSTIIVPFFVAILISVIYLVRNVIRRVKQNRENVSG